MTYEIVMWAIGIINAIFFAYLTFVAITSDKKV